MRRSVGISLALVVVLIGAGIVLLGVLRKPATTPADAGSNGPSAAGTSGSPAAPTSATCGVWGCVQEARFAAANALIKKSPGYVGIVVTDRVTGAQWTGGAFDRRIWAGSTPKLAFALSLLEEDRAGQLSLDAAAHDQIAAMLHVSDNTAADHLWNRYANATSLMTRWKSRYGMTTAGYVSGFPSRWGFVKLTALDLDHLIAYILTKADADDRAYLVNAMSNVGDIQHWGVWGAGAALHPGVKDGWSIEKDDGKDHWITATVGFVGPDQRYLVGAMYHQLPGGDSIERGVHTLTDLVATVFGAPVPAPVVIPSDY